MATKTGLPTTKEEVLNILINRTTPRAYDNVNKACSYSHSHNGGCAIGQCVTKSMAENFEGDTGNISVSQLVGSGKLPKRLLNLSLGFLESVQSVHDEITYWNDCTTAEKGDDGLVWNKKGKYAINDIIKDYNLNIKPLS